MGFGLAKPKLHIRVRGREEAKKLHKYVTKVLEKAEAAAKKAETANRLRQLQRKQRQQIGYGSCRESRGSKHVTAAAEKD